MSQKLIIVSNRLPVVLEKNDGGWNFKSGSGGLVSALAPVLKERGGIWIGWPGIPEEASFGEIFQNARRDLGYSIAPVALTEEEVKDYYYGFSNETLWPLFHNLLGKTIFNRSNWEIYQRVNRKFAAVTAENTGEEDFIWFQDYQLFLAGQELKKLRPRARTGFFLHIPFPAADIFYRLPWREEIIRALLEYDLLGFQTRKDLRNFIQCVRMLIGNIKVGYRNPYSIVHLDGRRVLAGSFPIGIDFDHYSNLAKSAPAEKAAWFLHEKFPEHKLIIGVDRLDYTKGIPERFEAFELCLEKYPELREKISLLQIVVPSRTEVPEYQEIKRSLDELVGRINGRFTTLDWVPIHYVFGKLTPVELVARYRSCEIALITPLNDGMNLVAKEYCASCLDEKGILILSEFAGAARQLQEGALLVNPYDTEQTADTIHRAFIMPLEEREGRMRKLREEVKRFDVYRWVRDFLGASRRLEDIRA